MSDSWDRLESLLRLRKSEMDVELRQLYLCVRELHIQQEKIRESEIEHHTVMHSVRDTGQTGQDLDQMLIHRHYLSRLRDEAKEQSEIAGRLAIAADEAREQVEIAVNKFRIVETLRNRRKDLNDAMVARFEERKLDDEITSRFAKKIQIENEEHRMSS
ncbi:MAG: hypothetical protein VX764_01055 [Planctomycetota bacterium]|nr:hypothetical protein [Planctomycetota bacterium]